MGSPDDVYVTIHPLRNQIHYKMKEHGNLSILPFLRNSYSANLDNLEKFTRVNINHMKYQTNNT
jgi:hypothetical protein